ncbi:MAG: hypothetical protein A3C16_04605 [Candidatus Sungbacteria bacterium RIFCSPHIGHO2_02_FULL_51_29]|uniref:Amidohydrolase-related domain-containing protein n=1 Tax=Candidatus Sungbacteria bacterium RIFCSPHIGHO2_02_FULL_51_29 TaxID=1802273 RepID=A0A1G2KRS0_9BACT|nr:MAG: hypothetical protein A3C16_04605 [Candidatus Sungbacteria bacterium RIFCSPHIGHO2_02_FULL_51_29]
MIVDTHTHLGTYNMLGEKVDVTPDMLIAAMDGAGVDHALAFAKEHKLPEQGISTENLISALQKYPQLHAIGTASPFTLNGKKFHLLKDALKAHVLHGLKFYTGYERFWPNDRRLHCLYEVLAEAGLPAIFHTGYLWNIIAPKGLLKYAQPLPIDELAVDFPDLKIVIAHIANPWIVDAAAVVGRHENVYLDVSGYFAEFSDPFSEEEVGAFQSDMAQLHLRIGSLEKLLFATDWPIESMTEYVRVTRDLFPEGDVRERFFWKNAAELFRLEFGGANATKSV